MHTVEFSTSIKNGVINVPKEYQDQFKASIRVTLKDEEPITEDSNFIDQLLKKPIKIDSFRPMNREDIHER